MLVVAYLQAFVPLELADRFLCEYMATWHEVDRLDAGAQRFRGDRADPAFTTLVAIRLGAVGGMLGALSVDFEV